MVVALSLINTTTITKNDSERNHYNMIYFCITPKSSLTFAIVFKTAYHECVINMKNVRFYTTL